ncbi:MAG: hypothetical protein GX998_00480 [Firmicutes bacterium]|nr:hypothetical protein [Bacillota bacterium]
MSKIIKANFRPLLTGNSHSDQHSGRPPLLSPESNNSREPDPAAAIVDAATVIRTARIRAADLLRQAEERVVDLVTAAEAQAARLRDEAQKAGFAAGRSAGYDDGYAAGRAEAEAMVQAELQEEMATIAQMARECQKIRSHTIAEAERDIVVLSLAIAEKIISEKIEEAPEVTMNIVRDVTQQVQSEDHIVIRVHPLVLESLGELAEHGGHGADGGCAGWELIEDASVEPGGCLLETAFGRVDARLETRFLNVSKSLLQLLDGE